LNYAHRVQNAAKAHSEYCRSAFIKIQAHTVGEEACAYLAVFDVDAADGELAAAAPVGAEVLLADAAVDFDAEVGGFAGEKGGGVADAEDHVVIAVGEIDDEISGEVIIDVDRAAAFLDVLLVEGIHGEEVGARHADEIAFKGGLEVEPLVEEVDEVT
jgi:hypothetical protein